MAAHAGRLRVATGGATAVLVLCTAACGSSSDSSGTATSATPSSPTGSVSCGAVLAAVDDLAVTVKGWKAGTMSRGELVTSAEALASAVTSQASAASGETRTDLKALSSAVTGLVSTAIDNPSRRTIDKAEAQVSSAAAAFGTTCE